MKGWELFVVLVVGLAVICRLLTVLDNIVVNICKTRIAVAANKKVSDSPLGSEP